MGQGSPSRSLENRAPWQPVRTGCPHLSDLMVEKCWACAYKKDKTHKEKSKSPKRAKIAHVNSPKHPRIHFDWSENYQAEVDYFKFKNRNRGADKVTLICRYENGWDKDKYLRVNHKQGIQTNESREGRKLDICGYMKKSRPYSS